jgi:hypothetical protein
MPTINQWNEIDQDFPVAGQDNESQGFRDNFSSIKDTLEAVEDELNTLNQTTVRLGAPNEFDLNANLSKVKLSQQSEQTFAPGTPIINSQDISYENGSYQSLLIGNFTGNDITFTVRDFPIFEGAEDGRFAKIRVELLLAESISPVASSTLETGKTYTITSLGTFLPSNGQRGSINIVNNTSYQIVDINPSSINEWRSVSGLSDPTIGDVFTASVNGTVSGVVIVNPTNFVALGAVENKVGITFTATGPSSSTQSGTARQAKKINFISNGSNGIKKDGGFPENFFVTTSTSPVVVEFWSYDEGDTIYAKYLGRYGETSPVSDFENVAIRGNSTLGNSKSDLINLIGIPKLPVLTSAEMSNYPTPQVGMIILNSTAAKLYFYTNNLRASTGNQSLPTEPGWTEL